ncbi:TPA: hypothetical protein ACF7L5_004872, partial [Escherichia coli]
FKWFLLFIYLNLFILHSFDGEYSNTFCFLQKIINNFLLSIDDECKIKCWRSDNLVLKNI